MSDWISEGPRAGYVQLPTIPSSPRGDAFLTHASSVKPAAYDVPSDVRSMLSSTPSNESPEPVCPAVQPVASRPPCSTPKCPPPDPSRRMVPLPSSNPYEATSAGLANVTWTYAHVSLPDRSTACTQIVCAPFEYAVVSSDAVNGDGIAPPSKESRRHVETAGESTYRVAVATATSSVAAKVTFAFPETVELSTGAEIDTVGETVSGGTVSTAAAEVAPGEPVESFATTVYEYVVGFRKLVAYADTS